MGWVWCKSSSKRRNLVPNRQQNTDEKDHRGRPKPLQHHKVRTSTRARSSEGGSHPKHLIKEGGRACRSMVRNSKNQKSVQGRME